MNRTDRLLAIVLELQAKGRQRAEDLAATFETSKRTIYRDMLALGEAGVPLISVPGQGYALMQGYFLPPLSFTTEEATMLLLGSDFIGQNFDEQYQAAAQAAIRKIAGVLPEQRRADVENLQQSIRLVVSTGSDHRAERDLLQKLRRAILERQTVRFAYFTRHKAEDQAAQNTREVDPYGLIFLSSAWHLLGYCHLRESQRTFRLDRMEHMELLPRTFQRPADFSIVRRPREQLTFQVRILLAPEAARWARETPHFATTATEETPEGLLISLAPNFESEILPWLLSWGRQVRVLEPESLRLRVLAEAEAMASNFRQP